MFGGYCPPIAAGLISVGLISYTLAAHSLQKCCDILRHVAARNHTRCERSLTRYNLQLHTASASDLAFQWAHPGLFFLAGDRKRSHIFHHERPHQSAGAGVLDHYCMRFLEISQVTVIVAIVGVRIPRPQASYAPGYF